MRHLGLLLLLLALPLRAEDEYEQVELRVTGLGPGSTVVVDRGTSDGLAVGDRVMFHPRGGDTLRGSVLDVDARSAVVELTEAGIRPPPGTRGEAMVPKSRLAPPEDTTPAPTPTPDKRPDWANKDDHWSPDMPLLAELKPVNPRDRERRLFGRAYALALLTSTPGGDLSNSLLRTGTDLTLENPFGNGGALEFEGEIALLTEQDTGEGWDLLVRRLSYTIGGTRFHDTRYQFGRFLQQGMPEFGILDGVEWGRRRSNGDRYGASLGFLPEPDDDLTSVTDLQFAGYYEWVADAREQLALAAGFQKTIHDGHADRDLLITRVRYLPAAGWDFHGTLWIDFYTSGDTGKDTPVDLTQALLSAGRRWENGNGLDVVFRHQTYADIQRYEYPPLPPGALLDNRTDTLSLDGWTWWTPQRRVHGHVNIWNDEDATGGAVEGGVEVRDLFAPGARGDIVLFFNDEQYETSYGARVSYGRFFPHGRWDAMYEASIHHFDGFPPDRNDLLQHRLRGGVNYELGDRWDLSGYLEGLLWDSEFSWSIGFTLQKRF